MYNSSVNSDILRNQNSWSYLRQIHIPPRLRHQLPHAAQVASIGTYQSSTAYGDLYTKFLQEMESYVESQTLQDPMGSEESKELADLIESIYCNKNDVLERSAKVIAPIVARHNQTDGVEAAITRSLMPVGKTINQTTPSDVGSVFGRLCATLSDSFKPMHTTSIPSKRQYRWQQAAAEEEEVPIELRFGTQAQRHQGVTRISPLFSAWCKIQQARFSDKKIAHLYINNLGKNIGWDPLGSGEKDRNLTLELEKFGRDCPCIAVITLPADKGLMSTSKLISHSTVPLDVVQDAVLSIALQNGRDFYISDEIKKQLYGESLFAHEGENSVEYTTLKELLENSLKTLGFEGRTVLREREQQAVFFHFIKFELTHFIISTLSPHSFNIACKDAIDRAGVASAYYNLMRSIGQGDSSLSQDEFERALHAAPAAVKGRGMNHQAKIIWNALDCYLQRNTVNLPWLFQWRDGNRPRLVYQEDSELRQVIEQSHQAISLINIASDQGVAFKRSCIALQAKLLNDIYHKASQVHAKGEVFDYQAEYAYQQLQNQSRMVAVINQTSVSKKDKISALRRYESCAKKKESGWAKFGKVIAAFVCAGVGFVLGAVTGAFIGAPIACGIIGASIFGAGAYAFFNKESKAEEMARDVIKRADEVIRVVS